MKSPRIITANDAQEMSERGIVIRFAVHPALLPALVEWLDGRQSDLLKVPYDALGDTAPTYLVGPRDDAMQEQGGTCWTR